ncbi:hypothetical protein ACWGR4_02810 [Embleya sp. NPDC055664]
MSHRVQYTNEAEDGLKPLSSGRIRAFKDAVDATIGRTPYGSGSTQAGGFRTGPPGGPPATSPGG